MSEPLKAAIIGAGMIAQVHRRSALLAGAQMVGVLGSRPARTAQTAAEWRTTAFDDLDALLDARPDVVHICTPNASHARYAEAALRRGIHVVLREASRRQRRRGDPASPCSRARRDWWPPFRSMYRYHPLVREIRARRIAGEFGRWNLLHGSYLQDWLLDPAGSSWRVDPRAGGASRAFADIGSHWCDLVEWVSARTVHIKLTARLCTVIEDSAGALWPPPSGAATDPAARASRVRTEDGAVVTLESATGVLANVVISQVSAGRKNRLWFEADGAQASAVFDQENPETITLSTLSDARTVVPGPSSGSAEQRRALRLPAGHPQGYAHRLRLRSSTTRTRPSAARAQRGPSHL
ncbi:Gfo/Idh/MocA family protein [Streptomyces sp. L7]